MDNSTPAPATGHADRIASALTTAYEPHIISSLPLEDPGQLLPLLHGALTMLVRDLSVAVAALQNEGTEVQVGALIEECSRRCEKWAEVVERVPSATASGT